MTDHNLQPQVEGAHASVMGEEDEGPNESMAYFLLSSGNSACLHIRSLPSPRVLQLKMTHEAMKNILSPNVRPSRNAPEGANELSSTSTPTFLSWI